MTETRTATERLREMLDALGVEYLTDDATSIKVTKWKAAKQGEYLDYCLFVEYASGRTDFTFPSSTVTPEQAVAATLGSDDARAADYWHRMFDEHMRECTTLGFDRDEVYDAGFTNGVKATLQQLDGLLMQTDSVVEIQAWVDRQWEEEVV